MSQKQQQKVVTPKQKDVKKTLKGINAISPKEAEVNLLTDIYKASKMPSTCARATIVSKPDTISKKKNISSRETAAQNLKAHGRNENHQQPPPPPRTLVSAHPHVQQASNQSFAATSRTNSPSQHTNTNSDTTDLVSKLKNNPRYQGFLRDVPQTQSTSIRSQPVPHNLLQGVTTNIKKMVEEAVGKALAPLKNQLSTMGESIVQLGQVQATTHEEVVQLKTEVNKLRKQVAYDPQNSDKPVFLPFKSANDVEAFNTANDEDYETLVNYLAHLGGTNPDTCASNFFNAAFDKQENASPHYTMQGKEKENKHAFEETKFLAACKDAMTKLRVIRRNKPNDGLKFAIATDKAFHALKERYRKRIKAQEKARQQQLLNRRPHRRPFDVTNLQDLNDEEIDRRVEEQGENEGENQDEEQEDDQDELTEAKRRKTIREEDRHSFDDNQSDEEMNNEFCRDDALDPDANLDHSEILDPNVISEEVVIGAYNNEDY